MHFDPELHEKTPQLIVSDDGLTLTNTQTIGNHCGFAQPALSSGRHAWEVTLGKQDGDRFVVPTESEIDAATPLVENLLNEQLFTAGEDEGDFSP